MTAGRIAFSAENRVMALLALFVPATFVAGHAGVPGSLVFALSVLSIVPLAAFIGAATEHLAERAGGRVGGLLNATFGNAPDLLVGVFGVQKGLIPLVKATLVGALISNSALIMGLCYVAAGLRYRAPRFNRREASHHSVLMMLAVAAVLFPSMGSIVMCGPSRRCGSGDAATILHVSVGIALVLVLVYLAYVAYSILGFESVRGEAAPEEPETRQFRERAEPARLAWPVWFSVLVLVVATLLLIPTTDALTSSVAPVTAYLGWTQVFVGIIIVANAGNAAEAYAAVRLAVTRPAARDATHRDSGLDLALGIASASSIQIATFVAPLVVLYSLFARPMNLVFSPIEIAILALLVVVFAHVAQDGESNWLEGAQLLGLYAMAAVIFYALPASAFGG